MKIKKENFLYFYNVYYRNLKKNFFKLCQNMKIASKKQDIVSLMSI